MSRLLLLFTCLGTAVAACSGAADQPVEGPSPEAKPASGATSQPLTSPNQPPGFQIPIYSRVGVGQEISFGLEVIDEESDEIRVELAEKPASARFDPLTLTVVWKPTKADRPAGGFAVRVTETQREDGATRAFEHRFSIEVTDERQPMPVAQPLDPVVETLITIHDSERLAAVNRAWPLDKMLAHGAELTRKAVPRAERKEIAPPDPEVLYRSLLKNLYAANDNPIVDPDSEEFDRAAFGNPGDWQIIAVRPRLDKKWQELRIVYQAPAHADTYVMFKFGPVRGHPSEEARQFNNREFSRMVFEALFDEDGALNPAFLADREAHGRAVAALVEKVLTFESDAHSWAGATFHGLPCEARLGGGSARGADGGYASGDAWGWNVIKAHVKGGKVILENVGIKGFATGAAPSKDGTEWTMKCAPRFDPHDPAHDPTYAGLCRDTGHVDLPGTGDGYQDAEKAGEGAAIVSAKVEAANLFVEHKTRHSVANLELLDPRRDLFEEKGMTCSQCHVRKFGVRDMYDRSAYDPRAGVPEQRNKNLATTYFVIVPTERWQPYMIDFQRKQECKARDAFREYLGKETSLGCPLKVR